MVDNILEQYGLLGIFIIVFAESGLLLGFFLPGDSLLFAAGVWVSKAGSTVSIWELLIVIILAAILGDFFGYKFGRISGNKLKSRTSGFIAEKELIPKATKFYQKHGAKAIVLGRFVPAVRTFVPIVAGISEMKYRNFVKFNVIGASLWGFSVTLSGYYLGAKFPWLVKNIELIVIAGILASLVPATREYYRYRTKRRKI